MKKSLSCNLWKRMTVVLLAVALIVTGVIFAQPDGSNAQAEVDEQDITVVEVTKISQYRETDNYTYPQPTEADKEDYLFAGWYTTEDCTTPYTKEALAAIGDETTVYAKYVPSEILEVKFQAAVDATKHIGNLRVVSTIDMLSYQEVGFEILSVSTGVTKKIPAETVYKRVQCKEDGVEFGYSPIIFDTDSEYFLTGTINNIKDFEKIYSTRAYWVTPDGTTVYGTARNARLSDSYQGIANVPIRLRTDAATSLSDLQITYKTDAFTYVGYDVYNQSILAEGAKVTSEVDTEDETKTTTTLTWTNSQTVESMDGMLVNLRFKVNGSAQSSNVFEVSSDTLNGGDLFDYTYNALSASYDGGEPDTSWYDNYSEETEFVIATANDFYGLASLVNSGRETFADNKTVYLGADIIVNTADVKTLTAETAYLWTAIGEVNAFAGTFDGDGHTIEGIYYLGSEEGTEANSYHGLFGVVTDGSKLQDFRLENSYFTFSGNVGEPMGSIAGQLSGVINEVYSESDVNSDHGKIGGLIGNAANLDITNCWYHGSVNFATDNDVANATAVGGLVGQVVSGTLDIEDCLTTGTITASFGEANKNQGNKGIGGLVGYCQNGTLTISGVIMASDVSASYLASDETRVTFTGSDTGATGAAGISYYVGHDKKLSTSVTNATYLSNENKYAVIKNGTGDGGCSNHSVGFAESGLNGHEAYKNLKDIIIDYDAEDNPTGTWAIRAIADDLADGVPVPKCFTDDCIDVEWYYNDTTATNFTISTANELYGLASISATDDFAGDTITLANDITLNEGDADDWAAGYTEGLRVWKPISQTKAFAGTFDGKEKTISGIYMTSDTENAGLFGQISGATIQDFRLENSFFESTNKGADTYIGSVIGQGNGTLQGVYSDANVHSTGKINGGLVGAAGIEDADRTVDANKLKIVSCWFNGTVKATQKVNGNVYTGGFVGYVYDVTIDTCLNTATVNFSREAEDGQRTVQNAAAGVGGLLGGLDLTDGQANIVNSISAADMDLKWVYTGDVTSNPNGLANVGTLIGVQYKDGQTIAKVYNAGKAFVDVYTKSTKRTHYLDAGMTKAGTGSPGGEYYSETVTNNQDGDASKLYDSLAENLWFEDELIDDLTTGSAYWRVQEGNLPIPVRLDFGVEP